MPDELTIFKGDENVDEADYALIMLHGRGSDVNDMKSCLPILQLKKVHVVIPQAPFEIMPGRFAWYRYFWSENLEQNLKDLNNSFELLDHCVAELLEHGYDHSNIILFGHSQGANLILEYFLKTRASYHSVFALRGCVLGEYKIDRNFDDTDLPKKTKIYIHSGRRDPYIPPKKIDQTVSLLRKLKGNVTHSNFEAAHGICRKELIEIKNKLSNLK